ncbi:transcriptional regulator, TetR family [Caminicella sporogenes DSM 14501]|uniref:Transcriptional regulator, TetR family n=1 Tax=Caminicella sporogenes DSM 14501 TaxID=1121266 RepID=A0A1M6PQ68_9FIRM|nr:TetR/AcrR family transcriptional regulator [Caminicella sporogenes]RKD22019.1 hypothetical protein BET04_07145 [Caminicella sporogenes]SHK10110.1 transcriptional regulator, TetR family [Caminicella sporogenes DSM 14501]
MARITDPKKLERIKKATMELVVKCGYNGVSISNIAKKAKVSNGYLYRHYSSKDELIEDLVESNSELLKNMFKMLDEKSTAEKIIFSFINMLFTVATDDPILAKFFYTLVFDQSYEIKKRRDNNKEINRLISGILKQGIKNNEINSKTTLEEVKLVIFTIPFTYIAMNLDSEENKFNESEVKRLTEICLNALK